MSTIKQRLLEAAAEHLKENTFTDAQINILCRAAGVSRTSFYREFKNLDDLFTCLVTTMWTEILQDIVSKVEQVPPPKHRFFEFSKRIARTTISKRYVPWGNQNTNAALALLYADNGKGLKALLDAISPFISECQHQGEIRSDLSCDEVSDWVLRQMWLLTSTPPSPISKPAPLERYVQTHIVEALRPLHPKQSLPPELNSRLDQILDELRTLKASNQRGQS